MQNAKIGNEMVRYNEKYGNVNLESKGRKDRRYLYGPLPSMRLGKEDDMTTTASLVWKAHRPDFPQCRCAACRLAWLARVDTMLDARIRGVGLPPGIEPEWAKTERSRIARLRAELETHHHEPAEHAHDKAA